MNKTYTITEKEDTITITDQHKNIITLSAGGIELTSCKDIHFKAPGDIQLSAEGSILANAKNTISTQAAEVLLTATTQVKIEAAAIEGKASGNLTLTAAMVMIN